MTIEPFFILFLDKNSYVDNVPESLIGLETKKENDIFFLYIGSTKKPFK